MYLDLTLKCQFLLCFSTGGEEEAQAAYDEAMNAMFNLRLECHRHIQPHKSHKDGSTKWAMIEMWPMTVSQRCSHAICCLHTTKQQSVQASFT